MNDIGTTLERLRTAIDEREVLRARDRELSDEIGQIERQLDDYSKAHGLDNFKGGGMSVSFKEAFRAKYEPEKWDGVLKWAVETGNTFIVQRRLTDAKVEELAMTCGLPDGLGIESYRKIYTRRI